MSDTPKKRKSRQMLAHLSVASSDVSVPCSVSVREVSSLPQNYDIISEIECQEDASNIVSVVSSLDEHYTQSFSKRKQEIAERFTPKKEKSLLLFESYKRLSQAHTERSEYYLSKASKVGQCGEFLEFSHQLVDGKLSNARLHNANFCHDRLCPLCAWRRSLKIFGQVSRIMDIVAPDYKFVFLTLTVPSVPACELSLTVDRLQKSFDTLFKRKAVRQAVCGFFRCLEITYNHKKYSASFGLYHPHFHLILAVPKNYADKGNPIYISQAQWLQMWRECYNDESIKFVDVRLVKPNVEKLRKKHTDEEISQMSDSQLMASTVAEVAKYTVKDSDYIISDDFKLTDDIVFALSDALHGRRLLGSGGCFKEAARKLGLDDAESGDLVNLNETINNDVQQLIVRYGWSCGCYKIVSLDLKSPCIDVDAE